MQHTRNPSHRVPDRRDHLHINVQADPAPESAPSSLPSVGPTRIAAPPVVPSLRFSSMRSTSPSSSRTHARGPSASSAPPRTTGDSLTRWRALIVAQVAQMRREGWRKGWWGRARLRNSGGVGGNVEAALKKGMKGFAALWVAEGDEAPEKNHLHGDSDLPPSSSSKRSGAPFGLSRLGLAVVALLFILGLRELVFSSSSAPFSVRRRLTPSDVSRRNPFSVLRALSPPPSRFATSIPGHDRLWRTTPQSSSTELNSFSGGVGAAGEGDTTAIVLHWKRTDNAKVILAHLCQYTMFDSVLVWNNNPDIILTRETFSTSLCPSTTLRIYNSPRNLLFFARYLACASHSTTPYCFFQDDDWVVQPLRAMYSQFKRDPEGPVVVSTNREVATLYGLEWCFFNSPLNTCFSWVGTGAFTSRVHVERFLATITYLGYSRDELAHADNSFTTFLNEPPYVIESRLAQLPDKGGHSEGEGIARNKEFIQKGLHRLTHFLGASFPSSSGADSLPTTPLTIDTSPYRSTLAPPLPHHPYAHHVRAPCLAVPVSSSSSSRSSAATLAADPQCLFLTNLPLLPPPDSIPYPGPSAVPSLEKWENHLGYTARGWMEGGADGAEVWAEEEAWKKRWSYEGAVDGDMGTAFRSMDVAREGDYIGLGLLVPLDAAWVPKVVLRIILEDAVTVLKAATVEVSLDGYHWTRPRLNPAGHFPTFTCRPTRFPSTRPSPPFPNSRLLFPVAQRLRRSAVLEDEERTGLGKWWIERKRRGERVKECRVELSARMAPSSSSSPAGEGVAAGGGGKRWYPTPKAGEEEEGEEEGAPGEGWRFVRIVIKGDGTGRERMLDVGWGVYEMWLTAAGKEGKK